MEGDGFELELSNDSIAVALNIVVDMLLILKLESSSLLACLSV